MPHFELLEALAEAGKDWSVSTLELPLVLSDRSQPSLSLKTTKHATTFLNVIISEHNMTHFEILEELAQAGIDWSVSTLELPLVFLDRTQPSLSLKTTKHAPTFLNIIVSKQKRMNTTMTHFEILEETAEAGIDWYVLTLELSLKFSDSQYSLSLKITKHAPTCLIIMSKWKNVETTLTHFEILEPSAKAGIEESDIIFELALRIWPPHNLPCQCSSACNHIEHVPITQKREREWLHIGDSESDNCSGSKYLRDILITWQSVTFLNTLWQSCYLTHAIW